MQDCKPFGRCKNNQPKQSSHERLSGSRENWLTFGKISLLSLSSPTAAEKSRVKIASGCCSLECTLSEVSWKKAPLCQYFCMNFQDFLGAFAASTFGFARSQAARSSAVIVRSRSLSASASFWASRSSLSLLQNEVSAEALASSAFCQKQTFMGLSFLMQGCQSLEIEATQLSCRVPLCIHNPSLIPRHSLCAWISPPRLSIIEEIRACLGSEPTALLLDRRRLDVKTGSMIK